MENIDIYYESLRQVYEQIATWRPPKPPMGRRIVGWATGVSGVFFALSLIPIIPTLLVYFGRQLQLIVGPVNLVGADLGDFVVTWVSVAIASGVTFAAVSWIGDRIQSRDVERVRPPYTLSPEQLSFISIYEAYKELKVFFVSHIDQHVQNSLHSLERMLDYYQFTDRYVPYTEGRILTEGSVSFGSANRINGVNVEAVGFLVASFPQQIAVARSFLQTFEKYTWFHIDLEVKAVFQALMSFSERVLPRLKGKQDLPAVLSVLDNLSKAVYAHLPEHKANMDEETLREVQSEGEECLRRFAHEVNSMTDYRLVEESELRKGTKAGVRDLIGKGYYSNIFS